MHFPAATTTLTSVLLHPSLILVFRSFHTTRKLRLYILVHVSLRTPSRTTQNECTACTKLTVWNSDFESFESFELSASICNRHRSMRARSILRCNLIMTSIRDSLYRYGPRHNFHQFCSCIIEVPARPKV